MPVVRFRRERILEYTGSDSVEELAEDLFRLKCEAEEVEGYIEVEVNPDRPDMYAIEGIARAVRGIRRLEKGWTMPPVRESGIRLHVDPPAGRPYIAAAVVYNYRITEEDLEDLIQFQEKLHDTIGRRRRKIAIGFHDLSKLPHKELYYRELGLDTKMKPLGLDVEVEASWVLGNTEQGRKYGGLALSETGHPFLLSGPQVIAMPPVINSNITAVEPGTRDLFIDVTGTDERLVYKVLDLIVTTLSYREGVEVGLVEVSGAPAGRTPILRGEARRIPAGYVNKVLGTSLDAGAIAELIGYMRHNAEAAGGEVLVEVPPFRVDILRDIDLVEDVAIAIGYEELGPSPPKLYMKGELLPETRLARRIRELLVGLGFTEVLQLTLISPRLASLAPGGLVEVSNPVQEEYSILRGSLIPSLIATAKANIHRNKPVKFFEIGVTVSRGDNGLVEDLRLGMALMDDEASYEDLQAPLYTLLRLLGIDFTVKPGKHPVLMSGRTAIIESGGELGWIGEVDPGVLEREGITYPLVVAELSIDKMKSRIQGQNTQYP
ncbi:MAG: phenylalanine--tRNA ligase subunit beta [Desulfurococcales archaeon]|nr:phenylalanine--tRNA ligase subunit beta [Desulfurococcales archaeon]